MKSHPGSQITHGRLSPKNARLLLVLCLTGLVAAVLRFPKIGERDFWFDESCTFIYVHNLFNWPAESSLLVESTNLPYYVLLRAWTAAFGESEAAYRSLSAVAATLTAPLLAWFAWRLRGWWGGLCCGLLAAAHPLHVYYAREARAYALWVLVLSVALLLLYEACRRERWRWWIAFGGTLLLCLHVHYFTAFWAAASLTAVAIAPHPKPSLGRWGITVAVVALLFMPYFFAAVLPAAAGGGNKWIAREFDALLSIPETLWAFLPAGAYPLHLRGLSLGSPDTLVRQPVWLAAAAQIVPALVMILAIFFGAGSKRRGIEPPSLGPAKPTGGHQGTKKDDALQSGPSPSNLRVHVFLLGISLGPLLLAWLYSILLRPNYLVARYDLVAWPAFIVWVGVLLTEAPRAALRFVLLILLLSCSAVPLHRLLAADPPPSLHRQRAARIAELTNENDLVIAFSYDRDYLQYYLHRAGFKGTIRSFPTWLETQVGWVDREADLRRLEAAKQDAVALAGSIVQMAKASGRVYILADSTDPQGAGSRASLSALLIAALEENRLSIEPVDSDYLIFRIRAL